MTSTCIFVGPSLERTRLRQLSTAELRPPAIQGDLIRAVLDGATRIGLIDGGFEQVPAVWHKEILWAHCRGVDVVGGASIGALRAAELRGRGILGVGKVYEMFASGELESDDEVAVAHDSERNDFKCHSDALVNIRWNLTRAVDLGVIGGSQADRLVRRAQSTFYSERHRNHLFGTWAGGLDVGHRTAIKRFVTERWVDLKALDAEAVVRATEQPGLRITAPDVPLPNTVYLTALLEESFERPGEAAHARA